MTRQMFFIIVCLMCFPLLWSCGNQDGQSPLMPNISGINENSIEKSGSDDETRIRLEGRLNATSADPLASGKAKFEHRERDDRVRTKFSVEVEDVSTSGNHGVKVLRDGNIVFESAVNVNNGFGDLNLDSDRGDNIPLLEAGDVVRVLNPADELILEGTLENKD